MDVHLSNGMTNCQPLQNINSHCILYGLRRPNCHHGKMLGSTSFHILWTFKSVFSPCPYGIVVVVLHFDSGKAKKSRCHCLPRVHLLCTLEALSSGKTRPRAPLRAWARSVSWPHPGGLEQLRCDPAKRRQKKKEKPPYLYVAFGSLVQADHIGVELALQSHEQLEGLLEEENRLRGHHLLPWGPSRTLPFLCFSSCESGL